MEACCSATGRPSTVASRAPSRPAHYSCSVPQAAVRAPRPTSRAFLSMPPSKRAPRPTSRAFMSMPPSKRAHLGRATGSGVDAELEEEGGFCMPAYVTVDNEANDRFTVVSVEVPDYSGLVRVIAWALNGLDLIAQNATLETSDDGMATNRFWITTLKGEKLSDGAAALLAERVRDFVTYCAPNPVSKSATEFAAGPVTVSNSEDETHTVVIVREDKPTPGFLLDVASILTGLNAQISSGIIQGCTACGDDVPELTPTLEAGGGRLFKFWVQDRAGSKLDYNHISALVYSLGLGLGFKAHLLQPPGQDLMPRHK